jgi:hypothetical protein
MRTRRRAGDRGRRSATPVQARYIGVERLTVVRAKAIILFVVIVVLASAPAGGKQREDPNIRSVQGTVLDSNGDLAEGAVVQLKNTKSLQVKSFITLKEGTYTFLGLSKNVDYELKADFRGGSSPVKTLSVYDTHKKAVINLRIEPQK